LKALLALAFLTMALNAFAKESVLFVIRKDFHAKNVLYYTVKTEDGVLVDNSITTLWHMGEKGEGVVEPLANNKEQQLAPTYIKGHAQEIEFSLEALKMFADKLDSNSIIVRMEDDKPKAFVKIEGAEAELTEIYLEMNTTAFGRIATGPKTMVLRGLVNGHPVHTPPLRP